MIRKAFEESMNNIREELLVLAGMTTRALRESIEVLRRKLVSRGETLIAEDEKINRKCFEIEEECLNIIATQQPVAGDLRFLFSTMQIAMELERIADYAKGIAVINSKMLPGPHIKPLVDIPRMAEIAVAMLNDSIGAFLNNDAEAAERIPAMDVEVDLLYTQLYRELLTYVMESPKIINEAMMLTFAAHNLERVGDRVVNICERVVYCCMGKVVDLA